jgi:hypothetical protein
VSGNVAAEERDRDNFTGEGENWIWRRAETFPSSDPSSIEKELSPS